MIDGGTGTEIQRRGVAMDGDTWCADANIGAPDTVREVHASYIDAGAELIIANTYATSPLLFDHLGRSDDVERIDRVAVALAQQAADGRVLVGGSISVMRPVVAGGDRNLVFHNWTEDRAREMYRRKAADDGGRRRRRPRDGDDARHRLLRLGDGGGHRDRSPGVGRDRRRARS